MELSNTHAAAIDIIEIDDNDDDIAISTLAPAEVPKVKQETNNDESHVQQSVSTETIPTDLFSADVSAQDVVSTTMTGPESPLTEALFAGILAADNPPKSTSPTRSPPIDKTPATMPPEDPGDLEATDEEDLVAIFSAQPSGTLNDVASNTSSYNKQPRPDYSSTSEDEPDEIPFHDPKTLLQSDIQFSQPGSFRSTSQSLGNVEATVEYADPKTFMRCLTCIRENRNCNRRRPFCQRCTSPSQCFYPKVTDYESNQAVLDAHSSRKLPEGRPNSAGDLVRQSISHTQILADSASDKPLKTIVWEDGDSSHSQKKCPTSIIGLIMRHRGDFEDTQLVGIWPRTSGKSTNSENGHDCILVDSQTDEEVPVARFIYDDTKQFFVAWFPASSPAGPSVPIVCRFNANTNKGNVSRNGRIWRPLRWMTWYPGHAVYHRREVHRLIATAPTKSKVAAGSSQVSKPSGRSAEPLPARKSMSQVTHGSVAGEEDDNDQRRQSKRIKLNHTISLRKTTPDPKHASQSNGYSQHRYSGDVRSFDARPGSTTATKVTASHAIREPQLKAPNLTVVFKDKSGEFKGAYPYEECDTAEKLFDVACVAQIAQIEPPATRLLKVQFERGGDGRIRPDDKGDFEKVFKAELKRLTSHESSSRRLKVVVSPYL